MNIARTRKPIYQPLAQNDFGGSSDSEPGDPGDSDGDREAAPTTGSRRWLRSARGVIVDMDGGRGGVEGKMKIDMYQVSDN